MILDLGGGGGKLAGQSRSQGAALLRICGTPGSLPVSYTHLTLPTIYSV